MKYLAALILTLLVGGCSSTPEPQSTERDSNWEKLADTSLQTERKLRQRGSLYSDSYMFTLYEDRRAYRIGDILTVELNERTQSSKSADSSLSKDTDMEIGVPLAGNLNVSDLSLDLDSEVEFDGSSAANQENFLRGSITVRVVDVLPNGALAIRGEKRIKLNQGDEYIRLEGLVRPEDIDVTNRVSSQRIANADISYSGAGTLADANRPGWFTQLFSRFLNPF